MWKDELKEKSFYANDNSIDRIKAFRDKQGWFPAVRLSEVEELIESLLKQQREICADRYVRANSVEESRQIVENILNAPEPGVK